jgi:outer membrane murein-binding lipoprotein Lpp
MPCALVPTVHLLYSFNETFGCIPAAALTRPPYPPTAVPPTAQAMTLRRSVPRALLRVFGTSITQRSGSASMNALRPSPTVGGHPPKPSVSSGDDGSTTATLHSATKQTIVEMPHELLGVMTCFTNKMMALQAGMARLNAKADHIDSTLKRIKTKVDRIEAKVSQIEAKVDRIEAQVDRIEAKVDRIDVSAEAYRYEFRAFRFEQEAANARLCKELDQVCYAIGLSFEGFNEA